MMDTLKPSLCALLSLFVIQAGGATPRKAGTVPPSKVMFNRDIRPVLSDNCFACHGPDKNKRQANLRIDMPNRIIGTGKPSENELLRRINLPEGTAGKMPPASFHKKLTPAQKQLLVRWIQEGGKYQKHWAYEPPVKAVVPAGKNGIDFLVQQHLTARGLQSSPIADKRTLIRRLSFDLLGLPPTPNEVAAFVKDVSPSAYPKLLDRLLSNPHYGERMAQSWLDVVRFADTIGYHSDTPRNIWPYRDWVINAFNQNKPFDRFTREQIAGDLLPNSNQESLVGSAYNRLLLTTEEGGAQAKDYEARYMTDRVRAIGTVWLGQTTGCSQCHDHKFDPLTTRDFYSLGAYFADIEEAIIGAREPGMRVMNKEQEKELARLKARTADLQKQLDNSPQELASARLRWEESIRAMAKDRAKWKYLHPTMVVAQNGTLLKVDAGGTILATGANPDTNVYTVNVRAEGRVAGLRIDALPDSSLPANGPGRASNGNFALTEVQAEIIKPGATPRTVLFASATASYEQVLVAEGNPYRLWNADSTIDGDVLGENLGWAILPETGKPHFLVLTPMEEITLSGDETLRIVLKQKLGTQHTLGKFRIATTEDPSAIHSLAPQWKILKPSSVEALGGTQLTIEADRSVMASGPNPEVNTYTCTLEGAGDWSALKIDALPDPRLPNKGPGRAPNGNFVITEVVAQVVKPNTPPRSVNFNAAYATYEQLIVTAGNPYNLWSAASAIDNDVKGSQWGWAVLPEVGRPQSLLLVPTNKLILSGDEKLQVTIRQNLGLNHTLGKLRISATNDMKAVYAVAPRWISLKPGAVAALDGTELKAMPDDSVIASGSNPDKNTYTITVSPNSPLHALKIEAMADPSLPGKGPGRAPNGNFVITEVIVQSVRPGGEPRPLKIAFAKASFEQSIVTEGNPYGLWSAYSAIDGDIKGAQWGWAVLPEVGRSHFLLLNLKEPYTPEKGEQLQVILKQNLGVQHTLGKFRLSYTADMPPVSIASIKPPDDIQDAVIIPADRRTQEQAKKIEDYFKDTAPELVELRAQLAVARKAVTDYEGALPLCLVTVRNAKPRTVRVLPRGNFLDESGATVLPATPAYLPGQTGGSRLDLANWLVSRQNPLTARTIMNRLWKQFFGMGLSKILEDLGAQGEPPSNPELLDWLACEFMDSGWDIKHMVRLIVSSDTYKQVSTASRALLARDPYNREIARQSRFRLDAEMVRDNALAISGLLSLKIGGPSVKPYQPDRYWENLNFPVRDYVPDMGENQHRRGLYTWWQRSFLHPSMLAFDAPSREECAAERTRSNIPQQALVLLNDPTYIEACHAFGYRILTQATGTPKQRVAWAWQQALQRNPTPAELNALLNVYDKQHAIYKAEPKSAEAFLGIGDTKPLDKNDPIELAAWSHVARVLLNLHETIVRP